MEKKLVETGVQADATGKKLSGSLDGVTDSTNRAAAAFADYQKRIAADPSATEAQKKFAGLIDQQARSVKVLSDEVDAAAKKVVAQAQQQAKSLDNLQNKYDSLRKTAFTLGEASRKSLDPATVTKYKEQIQVLEQEMETLAAQGQKAGGSITTGLEKATIAQRALNFVMSLNPIGIIIAAIVILVNQLRKYQGVIDTVSKVTAQLGAVMTVVTDNIISMGKAVYALVTLDFASFGKNASEAFDGLGERLVNAWVETGKLEDATVALREAQLLAALSSQKLQAASDRAQESAQDESKNFNQRIEQLKKAIGLEAEIARIKLAFAAEDLRIEKGRITNDNVAAREAVLEKELAFNAAQNESSKTRIALLKQLNGLEKERLSFISKAIDEAQNLNEKLNIDLAGDATDKEILTIQKGVEDKIAAIKKGIAQIDAVETLRPLNDKEIKLRQDLSDNVVRVIKDGDKKITDVLLKSLFDSLEIEDKIEKAKKDAAKKQGDEARAALADILDLENQKISITEAEFDNFIATLKARGADEEVVKKAQFEFNQRINAQKLQAELDYQKGILALAGDGTEADIIRARIQELEVLLEGIDIPAPKPKDGEPVNLFDLLGISLPPGQEEAIREAVGRIIDSIGQLMQARVDEAAAAADAAQDKVDAAQDALDKETDIAKQGLANDVDLRKKKLGEAKKLRDAALKDEAKARKAQIALDTVTQSVGLITSSVNIFKSLSTLGPLGIGLAVVTIGAMLAAFAATKAKAFKAAEAPKLRKGDKIIGRTHEQGGELRELEHGEQVVGAGESAGQDTFFDRMRKGKYKGLDLAAIAEGRGDYQSPISESAARTTALQVRKDKASETMHYNAITRAYERGADKIVDAIKKKPSYAPWKQGYKQIKETGHGTDTTVYQPSE